MCRRSEFDIGQLRHKEEEEEEEEEEELFFPAGGRAARIWRRLPSS
jgi:hypothetical protein